MPLQARRIFRLSLTMALSLAGAYALSLPLPFLAPLFALLLTAAPAPPMGLKGLLGLILVVAITLSVGLLLFGIYFSGKFYQLTASRFPASFWQNVVVTMLILLGPAVEDSANEIGRSPLSSDCCWPSCGPWVVASTGSVHVLLMVP